MKKYLRENGLTITLLAIFAATVVGQVVAGRLEYNAEQALHGAPTVSLWHYLSTGHFQEALFENWESEFLQMAAFVLLTIFLRQKGSSESKKLSGRNEVDEDPRRIPDKRRAPWPVRKGGWVLRVYENSLSLSLIVLFLVSFAMHAVGGARDQRETALQQGQEPVASVAEYLTTSRFWFESFQNWQSEFLSVAVLVVLSIYLRQRGSSQSKRVAAPHLETGGFPFAAARVYRIQGSRASVTSPTRFPRRTHRESVMPSHISRAETWHGTCDPHGAECAAPHRVNPTGTKSGGKHVRARSRTTARRRS